jgi:hypothetical protein
VRDPLTFASDSSRDKLAQSYAHRVIDRRGLIHGPLFDAGFLYCFIIEIEKIRSKVQWSLLKLMTRRGGRLGRATGQGPKWRLSRFEVMRDATWRPGLACLFEASGESSGAEWPPQQRTVAAGQDRSTFITARLVQCKAKPAAQ